MASKFQKTNINCVVKNAEQVTNNSKNPIEYTMGFDGTEVLRWQPEAFDALGKTMRMNSADLSRKIYNHFVATFHELKGCNVVMLPNAQITVEMFFERNTDILPDGKIMNLESLISPVGTGSKINMYERMRVVNNRISGKTFKLNNETKLLLSKFMYGGEKANLPNNKKVWENENYHKEIHIPAVNDPFRRGRCMERILIRVCGLDIRRILHELYGRDIVTKTIANETSDKNFRSEARYDVHFVKAMPDGTFIINIEQFDSAKVEEAYYKENPMPQRYLGIQMYN